MTYYIKLGNAQIPVTEEVYKAYCQGARKERYFRESDIRNHTFYYDALDTEDQNGSDLFCDGTESVEDTAEKNILIEKLKQNVSRLNKDEQELISRLYIYGDSLRSLAKTMGVPVTTLHGRHQRLLKKLKNNLEN